MTNWVEVSITLDGEGAEAVSEMLHRYVYRGVTIEQTPDGLVVVRGYFPENVQAPETWRAIDEGLFHLRRLYAIPEPTFRTVKEQDWAEAWKAHFHPIRVGERLLIKPSWAEVEPAPDQIVIELDPGMAFGTGLHPTTQLCLCACEWFVRSGYKVLDLGTGSGILAIAAAKLGARRVIARDTDELAVQVAERNVERNGVADRVIVQQGSLEGLMASPRRFDVVLVNILAKAIIDLCQQGLKYVLWPGGRLVASGIIADQAADVVAVFEQADLQVLGQEAIEEWVMIIAHRWRE